MDRQFEVTIDDHGHFDIPDDVRQRHGFTSGAKVKVEEKGNKVVMEAVQTMTIADIGKLTMHEAIEKAAGFSGNNGRSLEMLLDERKRS